MKESDRIALVAKNLRAMGAEFTEQPDGLEIPGGQSLHGATDRFRLRPPHCHGVCDCRAAGEGDTEIHGAEAAAISFPEFFTSLDALAQR